MGSPLKRQIPHILSISETIPQNASILKDTLGYALKKGKFFGQISLGIAVCHR